MTEIHTLVEFLALATYSSRKSRLIFLRDELAVPEPSYKRIEDLYPPGFDEQFLLAYSVQDKFFENVKKLTICDIILQKPL
ncbi:hypothetical protein DB44_CU00030 [Candidatus Protochlamydia amoebophila]|uniref:Uncharacterized protein n=1 Tax=Candidatus Protochlamydia amoebophila TaxID=362787 RepID=A0A0C1JN30_9BACT|nr:hypothetical protein DB44_CU00030 [Candidatus Protochlamydia amoebophila]